MAISWLMALYGWLAVLTSNSDLMVSFYPHDAMLARATAVIVCLSVCLCVCHTPVLYQNG